MYKIGFWFCLMPLPTLLVLWRWLSFKFIIEGSWSITEQSRLWNIYFVNLLAEVIRSLLIKYS
jgi:hypothetical protein